MTWPLLTPYRTPDDARGRAQWTLAREATDAAGRMTSVWPGPRTYRTRREAEDMHATVNAALLSSAIGGGRQHPVTP